MRGHSLQETKKDGRFHVHTKTYLYGAILKEECSIGSASTEHHRHHNFTWIGTWMDNTEGTGDSILKHKPLCSSYGSKRQKDKMRKSQKKQGDFYRTYGTRVVPVEGKLSTNGERHKLISA